MGITLNDFVSVFRLV